MKTTLASMLFAGLFLSAGAFAAPPADAPAGSTGLCKDGSYFSGAQKKGACRGHKGIREWYADAQDDGKDAGKKKKGDDGKDAAKAAPAEPAKPAAAAAPAASEAKTKEMPKPAAAAAPGGGADKVWVNEGTKVYHCPGDRWYGKTKEGVYMSEADASAKGNKPDHGKACKK